MECEFSLVFVVLLIIGANHIDTGKWENQLVCLYMVTVKFFIERPSVKRAELCNSFSLCGGSMAAEGAHTWEF